MGLPINVRFRGQSRHHNSMAPCGFLLAQSRCFQSKARIYAAMRIVNGLWVWEGRMSEWGEWWADLKVMIWWMAISVVSGELLALAMREIGF